VIESGEGDLPLRVSTLELFFDLVFVFAITQLTGILARDVTVEDGVRVLLVFGVLWWMYGGYVWLANARTPARTPERLLLLVGMAGFLIMGLAIRTGSTLPAGPCVAMGCGVALFLAGSAAFRHALRIGTERYRLAAAALALAASAVGVVLSVAAQMALLTLIVAAARAVERRALEGNAVPDSVEA
jgi:low temperature requirement protein LtrA